MAFITETQVTQSGDVGGAGISRYHWTNSDGSMPTSTQMNAAALALKNFYFAIADRLPANLTWQVQQTHRVLTVETGQLAAVLSGPSAQPPVVGQVAAAPYPAGVGARINWRTASVINGRQVLGATYIIPLAGATYTPTGTINTAVTSELLTKAQQLVADFTTASLTLMVYTRPKKGATSGGGDSPVTLPTVSTTASTLRSRRV